MNNHLGGHANITHIDEGAFLYLSAELKIASMLDVGCSIGGMVKLAQRYGIQSDGIDGDVSVLDKFPEVIIHDFSKGKYHSENAYDLIWSTEFLEHVDAQYISNIFSAYCLSPYVFITHARPGETGFHHVNCQPADYWISVFSSYGYTLSETYTEGVRKASTMKRNFVRNSGMVFVTA